jgi:hypothetical protein
VRRVTQSGAFCRKTARFCDLFMALHQKNSLFPLAWKNSGGLFLTDVTQRKVLRLRRLMRGDGCASPETPLSQHFAATPPAA